MVEYSNSIPVLPTEILIDEVFCRAHVKTLVQLSCACKFWKDLIRSDQIFIRRHMKKSLKNTTTSSSNVLMYSDYNRNIRGYPEHAVQRFINADENSLRKSFILAPDFCLVGCINGVFCFYHCDRDLYLWNPALHQFRMLPSCSDLPLNVVAFFSEPTNDDCIVVKILKFTSEVQIYKLSSDSWEITKFPYHLCDREYAYTINRVALVLNGALHWLSSRYFDQTTLILNVYDLSRKRFQEILLSDYIPLGPFIESTLGLIKGCISVFGKSTTDHKYEVWTMKEYGVENSWTKQFEFPSHIIPRMYLPGTRTSGKFVVTQNVDVVLYDPETKETEFARHVAIWDNIDVTICDDIHTKYFFTDNYVESLVSVFPTEQKSKELQIKHFAF